MKDLTVKKESIRREITIWLAFFILAFALNIYAIIKYKTTWMELLSQLHIVFLVSFVFYLLTALVRILSCGIRKLISSVSGKAK